MVDRDTKLLAILRRHVSKSQFVYRVGRKDDQVGGKERQSSALKNAESCNFVDLGHCAFFQNSFVFA